MRGILEMDVSAVRHRMIIGFTTVSGWSI